MTTHKVSKVRDNFQCCILEIEAFRISILIKGNKHLHLLCSSYSALITKKANTRTRPIFSQLKCRWWEGCFTGMHHCNRYCLTHPFPQWQWSHSQLPSSAPLKIWTSESMKASTQDQGSPTNKWNCSVLLGMPPSKSPEVLAFSSHMCTKTFLFSTRWNVQGFDHKIFP